MDKKNDNKDKQPQIFTFSENYNNNHVFNVLNQLSSNSSSENKYKNQFSLKHLKEKDENIEIDLNLLE